MQYKYERVAAFGYFLVGLYMFYLACLIYVEHKVSEEVLGTINAKKAAEPSWEPSEGEIELGFLLDGTKILPDSVVWSDN